MDKPELKGYQIIMNHLQQMITDGELKCGDKLPSERQMSEMFGISRSSVREALRALEMLGIVDKHQGGGNFIVNNVENSMMSILSTMFVLNHGKLEDFMEFRNYIELGAAKHVIEHASDIQIAGLCSLAEKYIYANDVYERTQCDMDFHKAIVKLSDNPFFIYTYNAISALTKPYLVAVTQFYMQKSKDLGSSIHQEHLKIYESIKWRDYPEAEKILTYHLRLMDEIGKQVTSQIQWG